jgi:quercetin dioxygenase-like cupin family protein
VAEVVRVVVRNLRGLAGAGPPLTTACNPAPLILSFCDYVSMPLPAVVLSPNSGDVLDYSNGDLSVILATGEMTGDAFSIVEHRLAPGAQGPPLHRHERLCDAFYVLEGSLTLRVEDQTLTADAGAFACFPPGVAHTFLNASQAPVRVLNINAPGGWDRVLRSLVAASGDGELDQGEIGRIAAERDMIVLE